MSELPAISIVIPCYNHGQYLDEVVASVNDNITGLAYELLIINDGSTDEETISKLRELEDKGYSVIHQPNMGLGAARNNVIKHARGKYILPLDSDNKLCKGFVEQSIRILESNPEFDIVYSNAQYFGEREGLWEVGEFNLQRLMLGNYIDACAVFKKEMWVGLNGYDEKMPVMGFEDWDFWLRAAYDGYKFYYLPETGFAYRVLKTSMIRTIDEDRFEKLHTYIAEKHKQMLGKKFISDFMNNRFKNSGRLKFKLLLHLYFPKLLIFLTRLRVIKSKEVF